VGVGGLQYVLEEGNKKEWFDDGLILRLAILSGVSLVSMVWWELNERNKNPVVDFHVLKNRTLAASLFLFVALGFGLFGGVFLFPLFAQGILGFTPTETGWVMMPGGLATAFSALLCGLLLNGAKPKADPRYLIAAGVVLFAISMWIMGHLSTAAGASDVRTALLVRGFGLGLLFVPINNVAYASIKPQEAQQAAGLINLSRQLGGAFGIAILANYVNKQTAFHRVDLVASVTRGNLLSEGRLAALTHAFANKGMDAMHAHQSALAVMSGQVQKQAAMLSFNDSWIFVLIVFAIVSPAILLLRKPKVGAPAVAGEAH
ncbi:MAG: MFS transporter, partial [Gemmatimonadota bacterium]|nr:MFS transporter [Gemmatimonadota bacterium]